MSDHYDYVPSYNSDGELRHYATAEPEFEEVGAEIGVFLGQVDTTPSDAEIGAGNVVMYAKTDGNLYQKAHGGAESLIGSSGGTSEWEVDAQGNLVPKDGEPISVGSLDADELLAAGHILEIGSSGGLIKTRDPASSSTPVQDAADAVSAGGGGKVILPAGTIQEAARYDHPPAVSLLGQGIDTTTVQFTDTTADGLLCNAPKLGMDTLIDGITFDGMDNTATGRKAWRFTNGEVYNFNVGSVMFKRWGDGLIYMDNGHVYNSDWRQLNAMQTAGDGYNGSFLASDDSIGPGLNIGQIYGGSQDQSSEVRLGTAASEISDVGLTIGSINNGGNAGPAFEEHTLLLSLVKIGQITNYGANGNPTVILDGAGFTKIDFIDPRSGQTADHTVQLGPNFNWNNWIGPVSGQDATINISPLDAQSGANSQVYWWGDTGGVTNNTGGADTGVKCLRNIGTVA